MSHITIHRAQEAELPATVNLQFINQTADYQPGSQQARRLAVQSDQKTDITVPVVMDDDFARNLVESILYTAWVERNSFGFKTTREYAYLEPTDVITLKDADSHLFYTARITKASESRNGEIDFECVSDLSPIYHQNLIAQPVVVVPQVPIPVSATSALFLSTSMLATSDTSAGFYVAMGGQSTGWAGASLYQSRDGGATFSRIASSTVASTLGTAQNTLGNWTGGDTFDETNTLTVRTNKPLSSLAELSVLNGGNLAAISSYGGGWEIIQFKNATLQSDGSYLLQGLLRGLRGTEWAMGGHATGDSFVMLDSSVQFVPVDNSKINVPMQYKIVSPGQPITSATAYSLAATAANLKPFSPVLVGGGVMSDGAFTTNWVRRDRSTADWTDLSDMPMSETSEVYEVDIYTTDYGSVVRTITGLTSTSFTYSATNQIADFGGTQSELFFAVYQMSNVVGRGYPAWGHLTASGVDVPPVTPVPATIPTLQPA